MSTEPGAKVLQEVRALAPEIAAQSAAIEEARTLPPDVVTRLKNAGLFRMFAPRNVGGTELDLVSGLEVLEELSRADGATGWATMIASESAHMFVLLPREQLNAIYAPSPDVTMGGAFNAQGTAREVDGGYQVTGRWNFATGCKHSDWLFGNCVLLGDDGKPLPGPAPGTVRTRGMLVPAGEGRIMDNWSVLGLRGTGSHDVVIEAFVPHARSFDIFMGTPNVEGPTYVVPVLHCALHMGAVALGIAQGAVDDLMALALTGKKRLYARHALVDSPVFRNRLGRADTAVRGARAALRDLGRQYWEACNTSPAVAFGLAPQVSATLTWVTETAAQVVTSCYHSGGASSIRDGATLQRRFRDIHTLMQHASVAEGWFTQMGAALLGFPVLFEA
ncbi:acyl-CoA dehydrogenase family protein [Myxococcaceae bacterium JPH2]|nr:acyl-CoA dehydrogenase family protein [Myxococcaceae bacterium JPH2]